jgi:hypothetical protein
VLDDIERRRFLVEPAREDPRPLLVRLLHVELDEGAGQLLVFPRRRRLARPQPHDRVLPPHRLPGVKRNVLDDPVALVEDAEHRDPLRHRRHPALAVSRRRRLPRRRQRDSLLLVALAARRKGQHRQRDSRRAHVYSGIQGS